jgi:hypothetical protein
MRRETDDASADLRGLITIRRSHSAMMIRRPSIIDPPGNWQQFGQMP